MDRKVKTFIAKCKACNAMLGEGKCRSLWANAITCANTLLWYRTWHPVFSIWKSLQVLQKACIKVMARAIYTYLFFSYTYTPLFCYKIKSSCTGLHKLHTWLWAWMYCTQAMLRIHQNPCTILISFTLCLDDLIMYYFLWGPYIVKTVNCPLVLSTCHNWELLFICPHKPLWFKKTRTTTTALLTYNTVVPNQGLF